MIIKFIKKSKTQIIIIIAAGAGYFPFKYAVHIESTILSSYILLLTLIAIIWYSLETRGLRKLSEARANPYIFISLQPHESYPALLNLEIQNIGSGPAYDINFHLETKILLPSGASLSEANFIKKGLKYLAPNHKIHCLYYSPFTKKEEQSIPAEILVAYRDVRNKTFSEIFILDPSEYFGRSWIDTKRYEDIVDRLDKIHKDLSQVITSSPDPIIRVVAYTKKEMEEAKERFIAKYRDEARQLTKPPGSKDK